MKNIRIIGLMSAALTMSISSCTTDNELDTIENNNEAGVFTIQANIGDTQNTRATVKPEDGKGFAWQKGDGFALYQSSDWTKANAFTIVDNTISEGGKSASFTCDDFTAAADQSYYAFYPQGFTKTADTPAFTYTIPDAAYTQSANNDTEHLKDAMIMVATGNSADVQSGINFTHKTALFRFGIGNATSETVTVKSVKLSSTSTECFAKTYSYTVGGQEAIDGKSKELNLNFGNGGIQVSNGSPLKAYALAIPADAIADGEIFTLEVTYNESSTISETYILDADDSFVAGEYYTFNINIGGATQITSVNINDFLHNETTALVKVGDEIAIKGTGFGAESNNVNLEIGEIEVTPTNFSSTEIRFNVPDDFSEGKISLTISGGLRMDYITTFKLLQAGDITQYVLKNYKAPYTPDGDEIIRSGEWMKPLDWIVENVVDESNIETDFVLQLSTRGDKTTANSLVLQTGYGFANRIADGKIYQNTYLVPGSYKLTATVPLAYIAGNAYLAVCNGDGFSVTTASMDTSLTYKDIPYNKDAQQTVDMDFNIDTSGKYSIGFIANLTYQQRWVKVSEFKLEYIENNQ